MKREARIEYREALLRYAVVSPYLKRGSKPPEPPAILNGKGR